MYIDARNLFGHAMSQPLPYEIKFDKNFLREDFLSTLDDDVGYFVEVDLLYLNKTKEKTKNFPFCPENEKKITDDFAPYMNENKPITCSPNEKIVCDWSDKIEYLFHYKMLNFYTRPRKNKGKCP